MRQNALAHNQRHDQLRFRIRKEGIGIIERFVADIIDHPGFFTRSRLSHNGLRAHRQTMPALFHLGAHFTGRFAQDREFALHIQQEDGGMVKPKRSRIRLTAVRKQYRQIQRYRCIPWQFPRRFEVRGRGLEPFARPVSGL